jgi:type I restriction enzyme, S subunit
VMIPLAQEFDFLRKTGRAASFGSAEGAFPFFTSSQELTKRTDVADCQGPALIFGTGGAASIHYVEGACSATNDCYIAVPKTGKRDDAKFYYYYLRHNIHLIENGFRGAGLKHVSKRYLESIPLPKSTGIDREKINVILGKSDDILRNRKRILFSIDDLIKSEFVTRFGTPLKNLKNFPTAPLKEFGEVVTGNTPPRKDMENYGDDIEWIKSDNINTPSHFLTKATEYLSEKGKGIGRTAPAGSTLVTCIAGSPKVIGNAALADREIAFNQQINAVVPNSKTNPFFLYSQFLVAKPLIQASSTNAMKGMVSKGKFKEIEFLMPSYAEQTEFGDFFSRVVALGHSLNAGLETSEYLLGSLAQHAFRNELRVS